MKLISRMFRTGTPEAPAPVVVEPLPAPAESAAPAIDPEAQQRVLHAIESGAMESAELMQLAVEGQTSRVRQAAAAAIHDPASWQALLPRLRGRDKAAYRSVRQRLDALLAEQRQAALATSEAESLCAAIERFASRPHDAQFASSLSAYASRWQLLPAATETAIRQRGDAALERAEQVLAAHQREQARIAAERATEEATRRMLEAEQLAQRQIAEEQAALEAREAAIAAQAREAELQAEAQAQGEKQAAVAQAHAELLSLVRLASAALGRGDTRPAARFRQSIDAAVPKATALPPHLARSLEQLDARLDQLREWKDFAAAPKRIELIEDVEALIGVGEAPETLIEHLRALRQEWRTINKGLAVDATAESERFEQAFRSAFQPCQVYLTEQAAIRRANLDARARVLERVLAFEAGLAAEQPDHPLIVQVLREAPQEWRRHAPVDRDAARPLEADFSSALDRLRARVTAWYAGNAAEKQALIARASQLATATDIARAIDEAKRLQVQWKSTGPVPHAQSQAMWEEFRGLCNAVFERRQQELVQLNATLGQAATAAEALCAQIEQASQEGPADRPGGEARLREWQQAFHALGELPRNDARRLRERYERAMTRYDGLIEGLAQRDAEVVANHAREAARRVRAYQRAVIEGDAARDALKVAAESFIAGVPRWSAKSTPLALRQAIARAEFAEFTTLDDASREQALRSLCIRAEILSSTATPPEDAGLRREQEMQLLRQGLGQARQTDDRDWEAMRIEWLGLGAVEESLHEALENRFLRSLERRGR